MCVHLRLNTSHTTGLHLGMQSSARAKPWSCTVSQRLDHVQHETYGADSEIRTAPTGCSPDKYKVEQIVMALRTWLRQEGKRTDTEIARRNLVHGLGSEHINHEHQEHGPKLCNDLELGIKGEEVKLRVGC